MLLNNEYFQAMLAMKLIQDREDRQKEDDRRISDLSAELSEVGKQRLEYEMELLGDTLAEHFGDDASSCMSQVLTRFEALLHEQEARRWPRNTHPLEIQRANMNERVNFFVSIREAIENQAAAPEIQPAGGFCIHCGSRLKPGDVFCGNCGRKR